MPPQRIELPPSVPLAPIPQNNASAVTPAIHEIPGGFPLPSPGVIPPSEEVTPSASAQEASQLLPPPPTAVAAQRSPHLTPTRERSEFMEAPIDSGPTADQNPATRTFTQILSKKRLAHSANPSAHSSTHSLTGGELGAPMAQIPPAQHSPLHPPQPPFAQAYSQAGGSKENVQSHNNDSISSRNSGTTLKPSMSPSASFRSHSTATEYSEAADPTEEAKEEKRSFWKGHKRGDSRATPTASQTDLHGSVPGGDRSMSSFGSSSGWGGGSGSRRSLQYDSHQNLDLSTAYGSPPDHEKPEKKGSAFDWFHKMRHDHKERSDKRERAKSPPGSSSFLPAPSNLRTPQDGSPGRGRSMDIPRPTADASKDVTPTASSPQPQNTHAAGGTTVAASPPVAGHPPQPSSIPQNSQIASVVPVTQPHPGATQPLTHDHSTGAINDQHVHTAPDASAASNATPRPSTPTQSHHAQGVAPESNASPLRNEQFNVLPTPGP
ncbi:hypothetical protein FB567DRAFT_87015 [Paraphoma chrysanthemicola]|uniref:Uncharacterized protein n=1 Tax=Paraphoma chrysanthemicola TaxID=798071 RepID=A0A8K0R213_9PLEO|nr:hypothetical protein FB567DRAFT_87015 [Paraphoma chrysanthemicola]